MSARLISIIDDDEDVRTALVHLVRSMGLTANCHASAEAFLASGDPEIANCIVTDLSMPGLSGIELKYALDAKGIATPVIMITAHFERAIRTRALASNPFRLLTKPFDSTLFAVALETALSIGGTE